MSKPEVIYEVSFEIPEEIYMIWVEWHVRSTVITGEKSEEVAFQFALTEALRATNRLKN